ncbi:MAG: ribosomal protein L11 methyltransferase [Deltaproteobacteria bacterium RIFCSPHIGHO2_12_FULL_43_9]|nr:MAG: ribosomal protein L11 methyltransferase [Deltaproteobacteria bacterium RIFCSPHIGHO2_12_FULL_43_9]
MKWSKLSINVPSIISEELGALLIGFGACGIEEKFLVYDELQPLGQSLKCEEFLKLKRSQNVTLDAYFKTLDRGKIKKIVESIKLVQTFTIGKNDLQAHIEEIADKDWNKEWKKGFRPIKIGMNLIISPSWDRRRYGSDETVIYIDPGQAFGTGHHFTTAFCLEYLEHIIKKNKINTLLDVGTGSGILAIAAAKLEVCSITAIDIDKKALAVARQNSIINNVSNKIVFSNEPLEKITAKFDLIIANILLQTILEYAPFFKKLLNPKGQCVISGILKNQRKDTIEGFVNRNFFKLISEEEDGEWISFLFKKEQ